MLRTIYRAYSIILNSPVANIGRRRRAEVEDKANKTVYELKENHYVILGLCLFRVSDFSQRFASMPW